MAKRRARSTGTAPSSKSEPVTDPAEIERLQRICALGELLSKAFPNRPRPRIVVTHPQGAALTWSMDQIMRLKRRAEHGRSIPWEVTDPSTGETATVWYPLLDQTPRRGPGRPRGSRKRSLGQLEEDLARHPGSSQEKRAQRLALSVKTLRSMLRELDRRRTGNLTGKKSPPGGI
jgi:hypothetical protein